VASAPGGIGLPQLEHVVNVMVVFSVIVNQLETVL
jgi:hypothetical protein